MAAPVNIADAIATLYPNAQPFADYIVGKTGAAQAIAFWNIATLGPQPSAATLAAVTPAQVAAAQQKAHVAATLAVLSDPGPNGAALRAIYLAAGLTAAQVNANVS